jgi:cell wall-associated NlpC family hydrolase
MARSNAQIVLARVQAWNRQNPKARLDPAAVLAVAGSEGLGGGVGDQGTSFGPFQLHQGGALPRGISLSQGHAWAWSPAGIDYALRHIASVAGGQTGAQAVRSIVTRFERPANPGAEVTRSLASMGMAPSTSASRPGAQGASGSAAQVTGASRDGVDALAALLLSRSFQPPPIDALGTVKNPTVHLETGSPPDALDALTLAKQYIDSTRGSFTNPGFAQYVHGLNGTSLPDSTIGQSAHGTHTSQPQAGDLAFFGGPPSHSGVMIDGTHALHGTDGGTVLRISSLAHPVYQSALTTIRRV